MQTETFTYDIGDLVWSEHFDTVFMINDYKRTDSLDIDEASKYVVKDVVASMPDHSGHIERRKLDTYSYDSEKVSTYDMENRANEVYYVSQEHDSLTCVAEVKGWNEQTERYDTNVLVDRRGGPSRVERNGKVKHAMPGGGWKKKTYERAYRVRGL